MSRREGGRGRGGGGYYSSRGRGKKMRGGRGSCRIATAEEVEARNAELSRCAAAATSSSEEEEEGERGDTAAAGAAGSSGGAAKGGSGSSEDDSDNDNRERGGRGRGGKQMKFKRPLDFLRQQRKDAGEATDDSTSEDEDDLSTTMGKLKINQGPQLTRREREAIEQQRRQRRYEKLHAEGKTPEAKADLARLAEVRRRREEAARLRAEGGN